MRTWFGYTQKRTIIIHETCSMCRVPKVRGLRGGGGPWALRARGNQCHARPARVAWRGDPARTGRYERETPLMLMIACSDDSMYVLRHNRSTRTTSPTSHVRQPPPPNASDSRGRIAPRNPELGREKSGAQRESARLTFSVLWHSSVHAATTWHCLAAPSHGRTSGESGWSVTES